MRIPEFQLERFFAEHEFTVSHLLCASDCEAMSIRDLLALEPGAAKGLESLWLGYTESPGHPDLRDAVSGLYETIEPADVLVHTGAEEAIFTFMNATLAAGDHVIVHAPCYQSLMELPRSIGCEVSPWTGREGFDWGLSLDELERLIKPTTRALVVNLPHNPTGYLAPRALFDRIVEICRVHELLLFCDEVYRLSEHDPRDRLPAACDVYENAVSLGVMSKSFGLAGLRIGWVASHNADILAVMAGLKDYTTICNSAPSEYLAAIALRHRDAVVGRNLDIIRANLDRLDGIFADHGDVVQWVRPKAGAMAFPRFTGDRDGRAMARALLDRKGVLIAPGGNFGHDDSHFRLGFGRADMDEGFAQFEAFLAELN